MAIHYPDNFLKRLGTYNGLSPRANFNDKVQSLVTQSKLKETLMSNQEIQDFKVRASDLVKETTTKALTDTLAFVQEADLTNIQNLKSLEKMLYEVHSSVASTVDVATRALKDRERLLKLQEAQHPRHTTRNVDSLQQAAKGPASTETVEAGK